MWGSMLLIYRKSAYTQIGRVARGEQSMVRGAALENERHLLYVSHTCTMVILVQRVQVHSIVTNITIIIPLVRVPNMLSERGVAWGTYSDINPKKRE